MYDIGFNKKEGVLTLRLYKKDMSYLEMLKAALRAIKIEMMRGEEGEDLCNKY